LILPAQFKITPEVSVALFMEFRSRAPVDGCQKKTVLEGPGLLRVAHQTTAPASLIPNA